MVACEQSSILTETEKKLHVFIATFYFIFFQFVGFTLAGAATLGHKHLELNRR